MNCIKRFGNSSEKRLRQSSFGKQIASYWSYIQKESPGSVLINMFLKISQNSQENIYVRVSFLIKLQAEEIFNNNFFTEHFWTTVFVHLLQIHCKRTRSWYFPEHIYEVRHVFTENIARKKRISKTLLLALFCA